MAQSWDLFHWANDPLDGEAPYRDGEIIEADSDMDDNPSTKADRQRRRQAIAQRYLLGIVPFIQSASLQGPFDLDSGWVNPWKYVGHRQRAPPHSALPRIENITIDLVETDNQTLEEICQYDADNEDEAGEAFEDDYPNVRNATDMDLPDVKGAPFPFIDGRLYFDSDDEDPVMLQPTLHQTNESQFNGDSRRQAHLEQKIGKKRNADTGWLKGRNIAKRSRHVVLHHSSPTPVGGYRQMADERFRLQSFSMADAAGKPQGYGMSRELQSANTHHAGPYDKTRASASKVLPDLDWPFEYYKTPAGHTPMMQRRPSPERDALPKRAILIDDDSSVTSTQETEQDLKKGCSRSDTDQRLDREYLTASTSTAFRNGRSTELICEENYDDLCLDDIHGLDQASRLAITGARLDLAVETAKPTRLDIRETSLPEMNAEDIRSTKLARQLSRGGTLLGTANDQSTDQVYLPLSIVPEIRDEAIVDFEDMTAFRNTPSSASEQSFQYRKTNYRLRSCRTSAISGEKQSPRGGNQAKAGITYNSLKSTIDTHDKATRPSSFEDEGVTKVDVLVERKFQKKKRRTRSNLHEPQSESSSIRMENVEGSSPDPLSEGFRGSSQARVTPSNSGQIIVNEIARSSLQNSRGNIDDNETGLAQSDPLTHSIRENLDMSISPSSPLRPKVLKSSTGLKSPRINLQPSRKSSKSDLLDDTRASLHPNSQDKKRAANLWPEFARSKLRMPDDRVQNPSPEYSQDAKTTSRDPYILKHTPRLRDSKILVASRNSKQSPWITAGIETVGRMSSPISAPDETVDDEAEDQTWLYGGNLRKIDDRKTISFDSHSQLAAQKADIDQEPYSPKSPTSKKDLTGVVLHFTSLPSTQILVEATTNNPWNSAIKRSSSANAQKNVTFSSLPDSVSSGNFPKDRTSFWTPPPPQLVRLADSDDPFDDRLMTTKVVEVDEKSPKNPANTPCINLPAVKSHARFLPPSPAVGAMAEAFIAADKQILRKSSGDNDKAASSQLNSMDVENLGYLSKIKAQRPRARSSSPLDESFTIAPNGRLTAVNVGISGYDAEANLANVIEEMSGIFEGWDIDTELKKAKANGSENRRDVKGRRQRGYLSGVSNR